jgi:protein-L-isoaspartate(D-aspartate) O-methyltransferase
MNGFEFDEYCWFDRSSAVKPLDTERIKAMPDTYPFGV